MKQREELDAEGRIKSLESVGEERTEHQAEVAAEITLLLRQSSPRQQEVTSLDYG